jgi:hypothetical protein
MKRQGRTGCPALERGGVMMQGVNTPHFSAGMHPMVKNIYAGYDLVAVRR